MSEMDWNRTWRRWCRMAGVMALGWWLTGSAAAADRPVFVQLVLNVDDHVNHELNEERLRRTLDLVERLRREPVGRDLSCLYLFTGASAATLVERRSNGLYDALLEAVRAGGAEIGYDGSEEPTPAARPRPNFRSARSPVDRWRARIEVLEWFLSEGRHFVTGEPDPTTRGGLAGFVEVFGPPAAVWGANLDVGVDPELSHLLDRLGLDPLLPGLPSRDAPPARHLHGYRGNATMFATLIAPVQDTAPELFWLNHRLHLSDYTGEGTGVVAAHGGVPAFEALVARLDRTRPHVVRVRLGAPGLDTRVGFGRRNYVTPLEFAYDNPRDIRLPDDALLDRATVEEGYARQDALVRWVLTTFAPANPGSGFVSVARLRQMVGRGKPLVVRREALPASVRSFLDTWHAQGMSPPDGLRVGDEDLSLADLVAVLTTAVAGRREETRSSDAIVAPRVFGPLVLGDEGAVEPSTVTVGAVVAAAGALSSRFAETGWQPVPVAMVPAAVRVGGVEVDAAQFLHLLCEAALASRDETHLTVRPLSMRTALGEALPSSRGRVETGAVWTLRPARLHWEPGS